MTDMMRGRPGESGEPAQPIESGEHQPIAIIGIGCRFPGGANGPAAYWDLLSKGVDASTEVHAEGWDVNPVYDAEVGKPEETRTRWGGFIEGDDEFDAAFFGISPREAVRVDPEQRVLLEVAYEALEDAGQP